MNSSLNNSERMVLDSPITMLCKTCDKPVSDTYWIPFCSGNCAHRLITSALSKGRFSEYSFDRENKRIRIE
jgi:hypothetical protein